MKLVDVDNDGTISFTEFFFFLVLLQIPEQKLRRMINLKYKETGGKMTRDQASEMLHEIRKSSGAGKRSTNKAALDARQIKATDEDFLKTNKAICEILFKGKELVGFEDILDLQNKFNEDLWHYQFHTFEPVKGKISTENFLKSNTQSLKGNHVKIFLKRLKIICDKFEDDPGVNLQEFIAYQYFFNNLDVVYAQVAMYKFLDQERFT